MPSHTDTIMPRKQWDFPFERPKIIMGEANFRAHSPVGKNLIVKARKLIKQRKKK